MEWRFEEWRECLHAITGFEQSGIHRQAEISVYFG